MAVEVGGCSGSSRFSLGTVVGQSEVARAPLELAIRNP